MSARLPDAVLRLGAAARPDLEVAPDRGAHRRHAGRLASPLYWLTGLAALEAAL